MAGHCHQEKIQVIQTTQKADVNQELAKVKLLLKTSGHL